MQKSFAVLLICAIANQAIALPTLQDISSVFSSVTQQHEAALNSDLQDTLTTIQSIASNTISALNGFIPTLLAVPLLSPYRVNALLAVAKIPVQIVAINTDVAQVTVKLEGAVEEEIVGTNALVQEASTQMESVLVDVQELTNGSNATTGCAGAAEQSVSNLVTNLASTISKCNSAAEKVIENLYMYVVEEYKFNEKRFTNEGALETVPGVLGAIMYTVVELIPVLHSAFLLVVNDLSNARQNCARHVKTLIEDTRNSTIVNFQSCLDSA